MTNIKIEAENQIRHTDTRHRNTAIQVNSSQTDRYTNRETEQQADIHE